MVRDIRGERQRLGDGAAETGMAAVIEGTTVTNGGAQLEGGVEGSFEGVGLTVVVKVGVGGVRRV